MMIKKADPLMYFKIGKHKFIQFNYLDFLSYASGLSKSKVKRLFEQGAIDIHIPDHERPTNDTS